MNAAEFAALAAAEGEHWYYRGKRDIVRHWIAAVARLAPDDVLLDVGAGTGRFVAELAGRCRAAGVEWHPEALAYAARRGVPIVRGTIERLPIRSGRAAVVTALDVLEHVDDDAAALAELVRVTRPGGVLVIHVPAFAILWSDWDVALGHRRRYTRTSLRRLLAGAPLVVRRCAYVNSAAFAPILAYRLLADRLGLARARRLEHAIPSARLNRLLYRSFVWPARWRWFSPPAGVSLLCVAQRTA
jgi:SAM-dependent methyltransferase